jgi:hypothetical protein
MKFDKIYNEIIDSKLNFLNEEISLDNFDWDIFFEIYSKFSVFESVSKSALYKDEYRVNDRRHLEYIFTVGDLNFLGILDFNRCKNELDSLKEDLIKYEFKKINTTPLKELSDGYSKNLDKFVLKYQFRDEDNSTIQTNKVGNKAFAVLKAASSILLSGIEKIGLDNIFCIEMHISKNESRRLFLYRKMIERYDSFGKVFKNEFIDTTTDNNYITYYRWK